MPNYHREKKVTWDIWNEKFDTSYNKDIIDPILVKKSQDNHKLCEKLTHDATYSDESKNRFS